MVDINELRSLVRRLRAEGSPPVEWDPAEEQEDGTTALGYAREMTDAQHDALVMISDPELVYVNPEDYGSFRRRYEALDLADIAVLTRQQVLEFLRVLHRADYWDNGEWQQMFASGRGLALFERWLTLAEDGRC